MKQISGSSLSQFLVIGTNFTKADTQIRSLFAITSSGMERVYTNAKEKGLRDFFVLSTCNRTEFYAFAPEYILKELIADQLTLKAGDFDTYFYIRSGVEAVRHLFRVSSGLDSQIIGDYEIVGQLKMAVQLARHHGMIDTLTDRISSLAFQASKEVKATTNLSSGKYSVGFAAAELISEHYPASSKASILIVGMGKFGQTLSRNLNDYFPDSRLTLCNRTPEHSEKLAEELGADVLPFENFTDHLDQFNVVITAAQSEKYLITPAHLSANKATIFVDLGIPQVIDPQMKSVLGLKLFTVDDVSEFHNQLMKQRYLEVPKAESILEDFIFQLIQWQNIFFKRDILQSYKARVQELVPAGQPENKKVEKVFSNLMQNIRVNGYQGCLLIETINEVMSFEK